MTFLVAVLLVHDGITMLVLPKVEYPFWACERLAADLRRARQEGTIGAFCYPAPSTDQGAGGSSWSGNRALRQ